MKSNFITIIVLAIVGGALAGGYLYWKSNTSAPSPTVTPAHDEHDGHDHGDDHAGHDHAAADSGHGQGHGITMAEGDTLCPKHRIPQSKDGFCHPEVIAAMGFCKEHDVDEAFCTRCSPVLIAAFKAEGDWCTEHTLPESQCVICKGGTDAVGHGHDVAAADGAAMCPKHRIPQSKDGFCHPEVIAAMGFCKEHDVDEAFCTRCSPILIAAFKAEGDWCAEHNLPESQCAICKGNSGV